jgi:hypothetical protein
MQASSAPYPVSLAFDPPEGVARWRPLVAWLLAIPHFIVLYVLGLVAGVCALISWFVILFTGRMPDGLANLIAMTLRYQARATTYALFLREEYPPFAFDAVAADPGDDPRVRLDVIPALTDRNRVTVFFRYFMLIPQVIVLWFVGVGAAVAILIAWFAVLFTGKWPDGLRDFVLGYLRWSYRVSGYAMLLTDEYPPFSTD